MTLSKNAQAVIAAYESLSIGGKTIRCPYFNNKKSGSRAALRATVGKGTPEDIAQEAQIIALREKKDLAQMDEQAIRAFLVDHNLGIECSGFVFHVLSAQLKSKGSSLKKKLSFSSKSLVRKCLAFWRTVENTNVKVLADNENSHDIALANAEPGDMVIMLGTGSSHDLDHVLLITEVTDTIISYAHALNWKSDGEYNHGIRRGTIEIKKPAGTLLDQTGTESGESSEKNETLWRAKTANTLPIKRLRI